MRTSMRTVVFGFALALTACADVSDTNGEGEVAQTGDQSVDARESALINPNLTGGLTVTPLDPGIIALDPGGELAPAGTKKTPCEKASNQFYRAQAAYLAAAAALRACGFGFEPQCASLAAALDVANQNLISTYAKFLDECP